MGISIRERIKVLNKDGLKYAYESCCEEYRRRLCEQWDIMPSQTSWSPAMCEGLLYIDFIGGIVLDIDQIILLVSNDVKLDDFIRYWDYASRTETGVINMKNWFIKGLRPKGYEKVD